MTALVTFDFIGGSVPVQGEGVVADGRHFYFRARGEAWELLLGSSVDAAIEDPSWSWSEPFGDKPYEAGYMEEEVARAIVESCADMLAAGVAPPRGDRDEPDDETLARRLARVIVEDICTYHAEPMARAGAGARAAVAEQIDEGRQLFRERTDARFHGAFEEALVHIDARAKDRVAHDVWLLDVESARSVGRRWAAMMRRLPRGAWDSARTDGVRWITAWTPAGAIRDAALAELAR